MNYLLDTCIISELVRPVPNKAVMNWLASVPSEHLFLSALTIGEVKRGIARMPESKKKTRLLGWFEMLLSDYSDRIIPVDRAIAEAWGNLQAIAEEAGQRMSVIDGYIAATAAARQMVVVTRNEDDFAPSHQVVINPWKAL